MRKKKMTLQRPVVLGVVFLLLIAGLAMGMAGGNGTAHAQIVLPTVQLFELIQPVPTPTPRFLKLRPVIGTLLTPLPIDELTIVTITPSCGKATKIGRPLSVQLPGNDVTCRFPFSGRQGRVVSISMKRQSGDFDPFVELFDPDGLRLAYDDDSGKGQDSRISNFRLPGKGTYTVVARSFDGRGSGTFRLAIEPGAAAEATPDSLCTGALLTGRGKTAQVPYDGADCRFTFSGSPGQAVNIAMDALAEGLDPELILLDPDGKDIARNDDDHVDTLNSRIRDFKLPVSGQYTVVARGLEGNSAGPFQITFWRSDHCKASAGLRDISYGEVTGDGIGCIFAIEGFQGQRIKASVERLSGDLQPEITLLDAGDNIIGQEIEGSLQLFLPHDGIFRIVVNGLEGTTGRFKLALKPVWILMSAPLCGGLMESGDFRSDSLRDPSTECRFSFDGKAGDNVTIRMTKGNLTLDPYLLLLAPENRSHDSTDDPLALDDDGAGNRNSLIRDEPLPYDGTYTIMTHSYEHRTDGLFFLSLWID